MIEIDITRKMCTQQGSLDLRIQTTIAGQEFLTITGNSGCGKTTLLRLLAGLAVPDNGMIIVNGNYWFDKSRKINVKPQARKTGFVFQEPALFPNLTVKENIAYGCKDPGKADALAVLMELKNLEHRYPDKLSGGQKQRVGIARALASEPEILLLDEPFSNLDAALKRKLQMELLKIHAHFKITIILVSHDLAEIYRLSGRNLVIGNGTILKDGNPRDLYGIKRTTGQNDSYSYIGEVVKIEAGKEGYSGLIVHDGTLDRVSFPGTLPPVVKAGGIVVISPDGLFSDAEAVPEFLN